MVVKTTSNDFVSLVRYVYTNPIRCPLECYAAWCSRLYPVQAYAAIGAQFLSALAAITYAWLFRSAPERGCRRNLDDRIWHHCCLLSEIFRDWEGRGVMLPPAGWLDRCSTTGRLGVGAGLGGLVLAKWRSNSANRPATTARKALKMCFHVCKSETLIVPVEAAGWRLDQFLAGAVRKASAAPVCSNMLERKAMCWSKASSEKASP